MAFSSKSKEIKGYQPKREEGFGHQPIKPKAAATSVAQDRGKPPKGGSAVKPTPSKK